MLKVKHKGFLALGINKKELDVLVEKRQLFIKLDDIGLPGQRLVLIYGETNEILANMGEDIADRLEKVNEQKESVLILPEDMN